MRTSTPLAACAPPSTPVKQSKTKWMLAVLLLVICDHALAQDGEFKVTQNLNWAKAILISAALIVFTGLTIFAGIEIASRKKQLLDVWHILVGAGISGAAAVIAAITYN
ncbi:TrbC/VirB2 family protein [Duganella sp. BuS-21]|uniref:TrbC/VirB2 family protein n=1 Tax=Duganella sp. BuS-21 TaxID=2943848 RepID=UPI0035A720BE